MKLFVLIGYLPLDTEEEAFFEEAGYTLVYDSEEVLQKHFPDSEYIEVAAPIDKEIEA